MFRKLLNCLCMASFIYLLLACSKSDKAGKNYVSGKVTDAQGNPIQGAEIIIDNTVLYNSNLIGATDKEGNYKLQLSGSFTWMAYGKLKRAYNNKTYTFNLHPDNTEGFTSEGAVRNFTWKLSGQNPDGDNRFYGASIQLENVIGDYTPAEEVEFTLTPVGKLVDGTTGQALTLRGGESGSHAYYKLVDIPLGRYTIKAKHQGRTMILRNHITNQSGTELTLDFEPSITIPGAECNNCALIEYRFED